MLCLWITQWWIHRLALNPSHMNIAAMNIFMVASFPAFIPQRNIHSSKYSIFVTELKLEATTCAPSWVQPPLFNKAIKGAKTKEEIRKKKKQVYSRKKDGQEDPVMVIPGLSQQQHWRVLTVTIFCQCFAAAFIFFVLLLFFFSSIWWL